MIMNMRELTLTQKNEDLEERLRIFGNKVSIICALESGNKLTVEEAFERIKKLYKNLKKHMKEENDHETTV